MHLATLVRKSIKDPRKAVSVVAHRLLAPIGHGRYQRFVVLSRSRTGSNMLIQSLNSHRNIAADYEIFGKLNGESEKEILDRSFGKQPFYIKAKGFKIFYYHPIDAEGSPIWDMLLSVKDLRVIHLQRRNILHVLVSSKVAHTTGVYGVRSDEEHSDYSRRTSAVRLSRESLERLRRTRDWEKAGATMFKASDDGCLLRRPGGGSCAGVSKGD